jgi:hypothetical protein
MLEAAETNTGGPAAPVSGDEADEAWCRRGAEDASVGPAPCTADAAIDGRFCWGAKLAGPWADALATTVGVNRPPAVPRFKLRSLSGKTSLAVPSSGAERDEREEAVQLSIIHIISL